MNRINFYANNDVLEFLQGLSYDFDHETVDLSVDFVNIVATLRLSNTDTGWEFSLIKRIEGLGNDEESGISLGKILVDKATRTGQLDSSQVNENECYALFDIVKNLGCYIQENNILANIGDFDPDEAGVMITTDGNTLSFEEVSGRNRPYLMCFDWLGNVSLGRPYIDEAMDSFSLHSESFEERLEDANNGDEDAMLQVALDYLNGDDIEVDPKQSLEWFKKLAELDNATGQFNLGLFYAKGFVVDRDLDKAVYWMQKAADNGDSDAKNIVVEFSKAADNMKKANENDAQAQADLSAFFTNFAGSLEQAGTENDYKVEFELAEKSADQNNPDGLWALGLCYQKGRGVRKNNKKAMKIFEKGAALDHAPCQNSLASYYTNDEYVEPDYDKAFDLFNKAANQGYGLAMANIGRCYQFGYGVECDMQKAIEWYEKALEIIDDPELEQKVGLFKMMFGDNKDIELNDEDLEEDLEEAFTAAADYEYELIQKGILPDLDYDGNDFEKFPRVEYMAKQGDERALEILEKI